MAVFEEFQGCFFFVFFFWSFFFPVLLAGEFLCSPGGAGTTPSAFEILLDYVLTGSSQTGTVASSPNHLVRCLSVATLVGSMALLYEYNLVVSERESVCVFACVVKK